METVEIGVVLEIGEEAPQEVWRHIKKALLTLGEIPGVRVVAFQSYISPDPLSLRDPGNPPIDFK